MQKNHSELQRHTYTREMFLQQGHRLVQQLQHEGTEDAIPSAFFQQSKDESARDTPLVERTNSCSGAVKLDLCDTTHEIPIIAPECGTNTNCANKPVVAEVTIEISTWNFSSDSRHGNELQQKLQFLENKWQELEVAVAPHNATGGSQHQKPILTLGK